MSDYSKLKRLAERIREGSGLQGMNAEEAMFNFECAATPDAILALVAENERIKARLFACRDCAGQGEVYSGHDSYQGHFQPPEPYMDVCGTCGGDGVLGPLEDFEVLAAERDQLKAENEALRGAMLSVSIVIDGDIRATVRDCVNGLPDVQDIYGYCDNMDAIILAAMSQGEQA